MTRLKITIFKQSAKWYPGAIALGGDDEDFVRKKLSLDGIDTFLRNLNISRVTLDANPVAVKFLSHRAGRAAAGDAAPAPGGGGDRDRVGGVVRGDRDVGAGDEALNALNQVGNQERETGLSPYHNSTQEPGYTVTPPTLEYTKAGYLATVTRGMVTKPCSGGCGKSVTVPLYRGKGEVYCRECRKVEVRCSGCGEVFRVSPSRVNSIS